MTPRQRTLARAVFGLYVVAVAVLCFARFPSTPDVPREFMGIPMDKLVHFLMFFPFPLLAFLAFDRWTVKFRQSVLWSLGSFLVGGAFAAATELVQSRLPWRSGDPADFKADLIALGAATLLVFLIDIWKQRKH